MDELNNKVFLVKIPKEVFEYLDNCSENKVGNLEIFLNKKRKNKPEYNLKFNKSSGPKNFSLTFNETQDFFYFTDQERKEDIKINNIDNFGKLIIKDENESTQLIENIFNREINKTREIKVKQISDKEKKYIHSKEIQLTDKKYVDKDRKEKRVRRAKEEVEVEIRDLITNNKYLNVKDIADNLNIPENQVKEILDEICILMIDEKRKRFYKLKDEYDL